MRHRIISRAVSMVVVIFVVTGITFGLMRFAPGDPALIVAMARYGIDAASPEQVEFVRSSERLDSSFWVQYARWLGHVLRFDLGHSIVTGEPVLKDLWLRLRETALLAAAGLGFSLVLSVPIGLWAGFRKNSKIDVGSTLFAMIMASSPAFIIGLLLILLFSLRLDLFPVAGHGRWDYLVLPAMTVGFSLTAISMRLMRTSVVEVLESQHILFARAKGLTEMQVMKWHVIKNALLPVVTYAGLQLGALMDGVVIVETIFAWPGVGRLLVEAVLARDFPMIQGTVLCIAGAYITINFLVDCSYMFLNPRIRLENAK